MLAVLAAIALQVAIVHPPPDSVRAAEEMDNAGNRYAPAVRGCYEREGLRRDPALGGALEVTVTIAPAGTVDKVKIDSVAVHGEGMREVANCVAQTAGQWRFSEGAYSVERMTYTFQLVPPLKAASSVAPAPSAPARKQP